MFVKSDLEKAKERKIDEYYFDIVAKEIKNNIKHDAIWAKAIANSYGDNKKAESYYIEYRKNSLKDETILNEEFKKQKQYQGSLKIKIQKEEDRENMLIGYLALFFIIFIIVIIVASII